MRQIRSQTKVIATIGPASSPKHVLEKMFHEGIDVCRLNFSHGSYDDHEAVIKTIRELNQELVSNVAILADLQGPKLRIGEVENNGVEIKEGDELIFTSEKCMGTSSKVYMSYTNFAKDVSVGENILIDDGKLNLEVTYTNGVNEVKAKVIHGGILSSKKGVNLPDTKISMPSMTEKDMADVEFALSHNVDWIALSFVRCADDIIQLKEIVKKHQKETRLIAKVEKPEALNDIDQIIDEADGIMIARGDLGVEVSFDKVPLIQKMIIQKSINKAKPVIIATQMMESMISNFRPTRAEANDVANAVLDGADCLMLSGETSVGKFPVEVIRNMQKIIDWTEFNGFNFVRDHEPETISPNFIPDSICFSAVKLAQQAKAKAIITFTHSGYTAYRISSHRPHADIFAFTANPSILQALSLVWGVRSQYLDLNESIDEAINISIELLLAKGLIQKGDTVIHVGSTPINERGKTNLLKITKVS